MPFAPALGNCVSHAGQPAVCGSRRHSGRNLDTRPDTSLATVHLQAADQHGYAASAAKAGCAAQDIVLHRGLAAERWPFLLLDLFAVRTVSGAHTDRVGGLLWHLQQAEEPDHCGHGAELVAAESGAGQTHEAHESAAN